MNHNVDEMKYLQCCIIMVVFFTESSFLAPSNVSAPVAAAPLFTSLNSTDGALLGATGNPNDTDFLFDLLQENTLNDLDPTFYSNESGTTCYIENIFISI